MTGSGLDEVHTHAPYATETGQRVAIEVSDDGHGERDGSGR